MLTLDATELRTLMDIKSTIAALREAFQTSLDAPRRHHHDIAAGPGSDGGTMLLMPAWWRGRYLGVKVVNVFPQNGQIGVASVQGVYLLFSGLTGELLATIEGTELTARRTAAASALAASYLARKGAERLLIVGTGRMAGHLAMAHAAVRPIRRIEVWGRDRMKAVALADTLRMSGLEAEVAEDLEAAVGTADVVSCATLSRTPLVEGAWLRPGTHLDLVGGFTPLMRETDDEAIRRCSVFIDTWTAIVEAGDIAVPLARGVLTEQGIRADLAGLTRGEHLGRESETEITLFKSVGTAEEDLASAILVYERKVAQQEKSKVQAAQAGEMGTNASTAATLPIGVQ